MGFNQIAKSLLSAAPQNGPTLIKTREVESAEPLSDKLNLLKKLEMAGFSDAEIFNDLRELYDSAEESPLKLRILEHVSKVRGHLVMDEANKVVPIIQINVQGDNVKVNTMLCPPLSVRDESIQLGGTGT